MQKQNKIIAIVVLCGIFLNEKLTGYYITNSSFANQFLHANVFHLALNCIMLWQMPSPKYVPAKWHWLLCVLFGWIGFLLSSPVVGVSGIIFASIGIEWPRYHSKQNVIMLLLSFSLGAILPQIALIAHAVPFLLGLCAGVVARKLKTFKNETAETK